MDNCMRPGDIVCLGESDELVLRLADELGMRGVLEARVLACAARHTAGKPCTVSDKPGM